MTPGEKGIFAGATGVFGGTFNPIHMGHLRAAEDAREQLGLERVVFVPSASPPHKASGTGENAIAAASSRASWVARAIEEHPVFELSRIELERAGPSYSVDTLDAFRRELSGERPVFLIGHDAFRELDTWREPERLFELSHFAVFVRPPASREPLRNWLPESLTGGITLSADGRSARHHSGSRIELIEIAGLDVSSTDLRRRLQTSRSVRYLVPESVRAELEEAVYSRPPDGVPSD